MAADDWRIGQMWKLYPAGISFPRNELCRAEWWILWRRVAGGLTAGQQQTLADPLLSEWRNWFRKSGANVKGRWPTFQFGPHETAEVWRVLGALELLPQATKQELGGMVLDRFAREKSDHIRESLLFAIGRLGARIPVYAPLNDVMPVEVAEEWASRVMDANGALIARDRLS